MDARVGTAFIEYSIHRANKKDRERFPVFLIIISGWISNYARSTFPLLRQEVHTYILLAAPFTFTFTCLTFAFQILLDLL